MVVNQKFLSPRIFTLYTKIDIKQVNRHIVLQIKTRRKKSMGDRV